MSKLWTHGILKEEEGFSRFDLKNTSSLDPGRLRIFGIGNIFIIQ
jgi:hypothetical protein